MGSDKERAAGGKRDAVVWATVLVGTTLSLWACTRGNGPTSPTAAAGDDQQAVAADNLVRGAATVGPSAAPVGPTARPVGPTAHPAGPTARPVGPTARPVGPTAAPPPGGGGGDGGGGGGGGPTPTPPALTVTINSVASGRAYQVCDCRTDATCGDHVYVDDLGWRVGYNCGAAIVIRTAYADRNDVANPFLTFSVSRRANVSVLIEDCGLNDPSWLSASGFVRSSLGAQFDHAALPSHVGIFWSKANVEGSIMLGPNVDDLTPPCDPDRVMYVVYVFESL